MGNLQIASVIKILFTLLIVLMGVISFKSYSGLSAIGEEIAEISNYQVPLSNTIMELEKDILQEEVLTYKLEIEAKHPESKKFLALLQS